MSTNSKTLADVQPGGRVRLGDGLPPLPPMGYEERGTGMGPHDVYYAPVAYTAEQMRDYARAALSARTGRGSGAVPGGRSLGAPRSRQCQPQRATRRTAGPDRQQ